MTTRRQILKWIPPVVVAVSLPAHAQTTLQPLGPPTPLPPIFGPQPSETIPPEIGPDIPQPPTLGPQPPFGSDAE
jgi:hypothetical protein